LDLASIIGVVGGFILIVVSIATSGDIMGFIDIASIVIVLGGTIAATLVAYPLPKFLEIISITQKAFQGKKSDLNIVIDGINELANRARKEGLLSLEEASESVNDDFMKKGIMLVVDGTDPELVKNLLETELDFISERHGNGQGLFEAMGAYAPAFGMIGTLIGLINMLASLDDPDTIGPSMAIALITTFYGSLLANLVFLPLAKKLKIKSDEEILEKQIILEGLLSIQAGENPRIISEKLKAFIPPSKRRQEMSGDVAANLREGEA